MVYQGQTIPKDDLITPVMMDLSADSRVLFASFSGLIGRPDYLPFDFVNSTRQYAVKRLFFRDPTRIWYATGLPGIGRNYDEIAAFIRQIKQAEDIRQSVFFGVSAGGFAAILFGVLTGASEVHAIASKTFHAPHVRIRYLDLHLRLVLRGDFRHWKRLWRLQFERGIQRQYLDLKRVFQQLKPDFPLHLYYCENTRLDRLHALHLAGFPQVKLHPYQEGGHLLAKNLRDTGELQSILDAAITKFLPGKDNA